jgi:hypothetical protein
MRSSFDGRGHPGLSHRATGRQRRAGYRRGGAVEPSIAGRHDCQRDVLALGRFSSAQGVIRTASTATVFPDTSGWSDALSESRLRARRRR